MPVGVGIGTAVLGAGAGIYSASKSAHAQSKAADKAANVELQVADKNNAFAQSIYTQNEGHLTPFINMGGAAGDELMGLLLGKAPGSTSTTNNGWYTPPSATPTTATGMPSNPAFAYSGPSLSQIMSGGTQGQMDAYLSYYQAHPELDPGFTSISMFHGDPFADEDSASAVLAAHNAYLASHPATPSPAPTPAPAGASTPPPAGATPVANALAAVVPSVARAATPVGPPVPTAMAAAPEPAVSASVAAPQPNALVAAVPGVRTMTGGNSVYRDYGGETVGNGDDETIIIGPPSRSGVGSSPTPLPTPSPVSHPVTGGTGTGTGGTPAPAPTPTPPGTATPPPATTGTGTAAPSAWDTYKNSTEYQNRLNAGLDATATKYAAAGAFESGAEKKAINDYAQTFASNELATYMDNLYRQEALGASSASSLAGVGTNLVSQVSANNQNAANAAGNAALVHGQGSANTWNAVGSGIGQIAGAIGGAFPSSYPATGGSALADLYPSSVGYLVN